MSAPRAVDGSRYHQIGTEAYAVVLDEAGEELSERHPGTVWVALGVEVSILFMDELGGSRSTFTVTKDALLWRLGVFVDGDLAIDQKERGAVYRRGTVRVDFSDMYGRMV